MTSRFHHYPYVGPADLRGLSEPVGVVAVEEAATLVAWLSGHNARDRFSPFTYVVTTGGVLRLAPRRCEHVACAGGRACTSCMTMNIVRDDDFVCAVCGDDLPDEWKP